MSNYLSNGLGETAGGDALLSLKPLILPTATRVWYVNSATGTDAVSPAGTDRERPLATLAQAVTNAAAQDIIVLQYGHLEPAASLTISKELTIVGSGTAAGKPAATLRFDATSVLTLSSRVDLRNVYFASRSASGAAARLNATLTGAQAVRGCWFDCGVNDAGPAATWSLGRTLTLERNTVVSVATSLATRPVSGFVLTGVASDDTVISDCIFDDGSYGFTGGFALDASGAAIPRLVFERPTFLRGASVTIASGVTGRVGGISQTGGGQFIW